MEFREAFKQLFHKEPDLDVNSFFYKDQVAPYRFFYEAGKLNTLMKIDKLTKIISCPYHHEETLMKDNSCDKCGWKEGEYVRKN